MRADILVEGHLGVTIMTAPGLAESMRECVTRMSEVSKEEIFVDFLRFDKYVKAISSVAVNGEKTLVVDFTDLYMFNDEIATEILDNPSLLKTFGSAAKRGILSQDPEYATFLDDLRVALRGLPIEVPLREVGSEHLYKLIMLSGIVVSATSAQSYLVKAAWYCSVCQETFLLDQMGDSINRPSVCKSCEQRGKFRLIPEKSKFIDLQLLTIQERPEELPPGQIPRSLRIRVKEDLVDTMRPGDRVTLTGQTGLTEIKKGTRMYDFILDCQYSETMDRENVELSPEDLEKIMKIAKDPEVFSHLLMSIAPSIYGLEEVKKAILYLLSGGVPQIRDDVRIRGDINVLLVGDPGVAKSQLLAYATKAAPRGLLTDGQGSSAAGLTASVRNEKGKFILEAGALVLGDMGVVGIDELDKMDNEDRRAIHPAMEQQMVHVAKGGIVATLNARCSIIAAANPALGRYNAYQTVAQNINLPATLLSRFDLVFIIRDHPADLEDTILARHIVNIHQNNERALPKPPLDSLMLKKYISYAKKIDPIISDEASERIREFYVTMRSSDTTSSAVSITIRQLESLIRISQAHARLHLREEVLLEDAEAAIRLMTFCLETVSIDVNTGKVDIDLLLTGKSMSLQQKLAHALAVIHELGREGETIDSDVYDTLSKEGIPFEESKKLVNILSRDGSIFFPKPGFMKAT